MNVIALRSLFVVMPFPSDVHEIKFVNESMSF